MAIERIERSILFSGATAFFFALSGQSALADDDDDRGAGTRTVNCDRSNASIQKKIDKAAHGKPTTIVIKGTCTENIVVRKDDLTLLAHPAGSGTVQGSIDVVGAQRVTIDGLKITASSEPLTARENASVTLNFAEIESEDSDSFTVFATRSASIVMTNTEVKAAGEGACAVYIADGSVLRMNGGNMLTNKDAGFNCSTLTLVRNSTARIRGSGNKITNEGKVEGDLNLDKSASGVALDTEVVSSLRIDSSNEDDAAVITGDVVSFNLASIDIRKAVIYGDIYADSLNTNIRLRGSNRGDVVVNGDVFPGDDSDSTVAIRNGGEVFINGNIDCWNGENVEQNFAWFGPRPPPNGPQGGYVNCSFTP